MDTPGDHCGREVVRTGDYVADDFGFCWIRYGRFQHSDDRCRACADRIEPDGFSDYRRIAFQSSRPETISQYHRSSGVRAVIACVEQSAEDRLQADNIEIRTADNSSANHTRFAQSDHGEAHGGEVAKLANRLDAGFQILNLGDREGFVVDSQATRGLANVDQPVLSAIDERLEKNSTNQRENGGICPDAECQRENYGDRKPFGSCQRTGSKLQVLKHHAGVEFHGCVSSFLTETTFFPKLFDKSNGWDFQAECEYPLQVYLRSN